MWRTAVAGITLLAFVNLLMGCVVTSTTEVPGANAGTIAPTEKIKSLVKLDGTLVQFDDRGGSFGLVPREAIRGTTRTGESVAIPSSDVWLYRIAPPVSLSPTELDTAHIMEVVLNNRSLVRFEPPGATYDKEKGEISGTCFPSKAASYALSELSSIRAKHPLSLKLSELKLHPEKRVYEVIDKRYSVYTFDSSGGQFSFASGFFGNTIDGTAVEIPAAEVLHASIERTDAAGSIVATFGLIIVIIGVAVGIAAATKQSCPFVYAFDGQRFVFDAEPLGGAICPGLARTDITRLDHAKLVDGEYRLLVRNEVPETQYINRMQMLLIDHSPENLIYPDLHGRFLAFTNVQGVRTAIDENGMSLMDFLRTSDGVAWQSNLPTASLEVNRPTRHEITVTLPKPPGAQTAWLVTNIGTSLWGSNMIRKTVEYRGYNAEAWLSTVAPGSQSFEELNQFLEREEMYNLKTWMKDGTSWSQATTIVGQGPLISEDRVYPLDVSKIPGDSLVLRFSPPKGFWTFDYIGVSYDEPSVVQPVRISAGLAEDQNGSSLLPLLAGMDTLSYAMPEVGDYANMRFPANAPREGTVRSVYLETSGYYQLHLPKERTDQSARLYSIALNPGQIVKTAMEEYRAWQAQLQMANKQSQSKIH